MVKDRRFQIRIDGGTLDEFDYFVGRGNRSKEIVRLIRERIEFLKSRGAERWRSRR